MTKRFRVANNVENIQVHVIRKKLPETFASPEFICTWFKVVCLYNSSNLCGSAKSEKLSALIE